MAGWAASALVEPTARAVEIWAVPRGDPPVTAASLHAHLTRAELERAARFRLAADRERAVVGRGLLRMLLAERLGAHPSAVELVESETGKPRLACAEPGGWSFNVSHSGAWVLIGLARGVRLGVDVEQMRALPELEVLMRRFFHPAEARTILQLPDPERVPAFFACWTRKEAFLKALGAGLSIELDRFVVQPLPGRPAALHAVDLPGESAEAWTLWGGMPDAAHHAAVAVDARGARVVAHTWSGAQGLRPWPGTAETPSNRMGPTMVTT